MALYHQLLTDHYHNPRNKGFLVDPDFDSGQYNPSCGDKIRIQGIVNEDRVEAVRFDGAGCILSQAAASLLAEYAQGKMIDHLLSLDKNLMLSMLQINLGPTRQTCVLLALNALQDGLRSVECTKKGGNDAQSREGSAKTTSNK